MWVGAFRCNQFRLVFAIFSRCGCVGGEGGESESEDFMNETEIRGEPAQNAESEDQENEGVCTVCVCIKKATMFK